MEEVKERQQSLREDIKSEVERYLGYADDVHSDYIYVNENTLEVGFRSRHDASRKEDCDYYSILGLIKQSKGLWFEPDEAGIEAIVQEHLRSPNIKSKADEWISILTEFLQTEKPEKLHSCRLSIGTMSASLSCFDEANESIEEATEDEMLSDEWLEAESVDILPMRKIASKNGDNVTIRMIDLIKLILKYVEPE